MKKKEKLRNIKERKTLLNYIIKDCILRNYLPSALIAMLLSYLIELFESAKFDIKILVNLVIVAVLLGIIFGAVFGLLSWKQEKRKKLWNTITNETLLKYIILDCILRGYLPGFHLVETGKKA